MIKIVVDSGCDISRDMMSKRDINVDMVPLSLQLEDKQFVDDADLNIDNYLKEMSECGVAPKTAAPSPESFLSKFLGEESIFAVTLSSSLSASYNSAMLAKKIYLEEIGDKFIHIFDSLSASVGQTVIALKINEFAKKNLSNIEIVDSVNKFIENMHTYVILEKFDNLVKTGRINPYVAKLASILSIKPICTATREGTIVLADKAKGYKKAFDKLIDIMIKDNLDFENRTLAISHVKCFDRAQQFMDQVMNKIKFKDAVIVEAGGICTTYANGLGLIVAY